jgi:hypothetical protein
VLAYGQTGSGKTHTMGTAFKPGGATQGVIPRVMVELFERVEERRAQGAVVTIKVCFIEIHKVSV